VFAEFARGMTVVDRLNVTGKDPNATIIWKIDIPRWKGLLYQSLRR
jgi:inosine-uridine nucleoside N-ribohydrolase